MLPDKINTTRLALRPANVGDASVIFDLYATDIEVTRYLTWKPHASVEETRAFLSICEQGWEAGTSFPYVIERQNDGQLLGMVGAARDHGMSLGYVLARQFWGQGYMTEAVRALVETALAVHKVYRVWAVCDPANVASARVMEKCGMQLEGTLRRFTPAPNISPVPKDVLCYSIIRDESRSQE